jgi:hypothetical protein
MASLYDLLACLYICTSIKKVLLVFIKQHGQRAVLKWSSILEVASCILDRDKFIYFKFGACKVLNLHST